MNAPTEVVLSGYYGYGNVGDDALCEALTTALFEAGVARIHIPCGDPARLPLDERIIPLGRFDLGGVRAALRGGAALFSGGGGLLQNTTSSRSLGYYLALLQLARWAGRPYVLGFQSIGPLHGPLWLAQVRRLALGARAVSVRDQRSARTLAEIGVPTERVVVAADAAFLMAPPSDEARTQTDTRLPAGPRLALCLRHTRHTEQVIRAVRDWWADGGWPGSLVLLACDAEDHELGLTLAAELGDRIVALPSPGPSGTLAALACCQGLVSERLHPLVFAAGLGLPSVAIDYDPKVRGLADDLGLPVASTDAALTGPLIGAALARLEERGGGESARLHALAEAARAAAQAEVTRLLAALSS